MAENAFLAALLKMAAEERLNAIAARSMVLGYDVSSRTDQEFDNTALEAEARAEVYERFAHRLISDVASDLILAEFEKLTGTAELLRDTKDIPFEFKLDDWRQQNYWRWYQQIAPPFNPKSLIITSTN